MTGTFYIPKTMDNWPWQRAINPHYEEMKAESDVWLKSFKPFNEQSQIAFDKGDPTRLAALAYPYVPKDHLRIGCDFMNLSFLFDEYTDVEDAGVVREMADIVIDAIHHPDKPRPEGEVLLGEVARQFWARGAQACTVTARKHFEDAYTDFVNAVYCQALDRDMNRLGTVESYIETRRKNIGAEAAYMPAVLAIDIPDEAYYHPAVVELCNICTDLLVLDNDLVSYNKEQAAGDQYNILTVVMNQFDYTLDEALKWAAGYHEDAETGFLDGMKRLPSFGPDIDPQLQQYIQAIAMWPRANDCWNFESGRYFGSKGLEIQDTRIVPIMPKVIDNHRTLRRENVVVPLVEL